MTVHGDHSSPNRVAPARLVGFQLVADGELDEVSGASGGSEQEDVRLPLQDGQVLG